MSPFTRRKVQILRRLCLLSIALYHVLLIVSYSLNPSSPGFPALSTEALVICPRPENPNPKLFHWNSYTAACVLAIIVGTAIRLRVFRDLGPNFTFALSQPTHLVTNGIYNWVQHPSYTGQILVLGANVALFLRWDGVVGCWISGDLIERLSGWGRGVYAGLVPVVVWGVLVRVRDEENMLKERFGMEWERWHGRTRRFVPGLV